MKKILILGAKNQQVVCQALERVLQALADVSCDIATHENALATFLSEDYSHVVIVDYSEKINLERGGFAIFRDISSSATGQTIIRCGLEKLDYPDYINILNVVPELIKRIKNKNQ